jgi:predicted phage terminase large subunit-like protein
VHEQPSGPPITAERATAIATASSLEVYAEEMHGIRAARLHAVWIDALQDPTRDRILITAPPEHGKSTWVAVIYPAWRLARDPTEHIVITSATDAQAEDRAAAVAGTVLSPHYRRLFPHVEKGRRWTRGEWDLARPRADDKDATMFACGVGSSALIGRRADCIIIDDPMSEETARSKAGRAHLATWCRRTLLTRAERGAKIVCIMTRWHQDDLAPVLLEAGFEHIRMPAEGYWGGRDALWPERFPAEYLAQRRRDMGTALYNCMYLGDPSGLEGRLFRREWFEVVDAAPQLSAVVSGWDLATSARTEADYSVKTTLGSGPDGTVYVLDVWRARKEFPVVRRAIAEHGARDGVDAAGVEAAAFQLAAVQLLRTDGLPFPLLPIPADRDKVSRALEWIAAAEAGRIKLLRAPWNDEWLSEVSGFPDAPHDDQVDSFGVAWRVLRRFSRDGRAGRTGERRLRTTTLDW